MEYYGSPVSLKSIAQISTPDGSSLLLQPYDKSRYMTDEFSVQDFSRLLSLGRFMIHPNTFSLKAIEKAIVNSDLGVTPNNDGDVIRLSLPPLTSERRKVSLPGKPIHYSLVNFKGQYFCDLDFQYAALPFNCTTAGTIKGCCKTV